MFKLNSSGYEAGVKKILLYMPPGYVATRCDWVVMVSCCLLMFGLGLLAWNERVKVPLPPQRLMLRSAYVTHSLGVSKSEAQLYFKVEREGGDYTYKIGLPHEEARLLSVHKFKKLWVAVDSGSNEQFVWAVYDEEFRLMMSRQQIEKWVRYRNGRSYLMVTVTCLAMGYYIFNIVRCGVWNKYWCEEGGE